MAKKEKVKTSLIIGQQVFKTLKTVAAVVPDPFGKPLVGAAGIALSIVETAQDVMNNREDFIEIGKQACFIVATLVENVNLIEPSALQRDAALLLKDVGDIRDIVEKERYLVTEVVYHDADKNTVKECWRRIAHALSLFNLGSNLEIRRKLEEMSAQIAKILQQPGNADALADQVNFPDASDFRLERPVFAAGKAPEHGVARVVSYPRAHKFVANNALFIAGEIPPNVLDRWAPGQPSGSVLLATQVPGAQQHLNGTHSRVGRDEMNKTDLQPPGINMQPQPTEEISPVSQSLPQMGDGVQPQPQAEVNVTPVILAQPTHIQPGVMVSQTPAINTGGQPVVLAQPPQQYPNQPQDQLLYHAYPLETFQPVLVPVQVIPPTQDQPVPPPVETPAPPIRRSWWRRLFCM